MKQVLQHARTGEVAVMDVPAPKLLPGCVLVRVAASLVSAGTERASAEFASKNLLQKAQARPDLVHEVLGKIQRDGIFPALTAVRNRLDQPSALGYSSAGTIVGIGEGIVDLQVRDRVACAGAGYAVHAEFACVPRLLVGKIPADSGVTVEEAAFSTVGSVVLHGIRTADVKLGDVVAVIGLGLLGQLTVQALKAAGCRVLGMDIVPERAELAMRFGADVAVASQSGLRELCRQYSRGRGADAVVITAETSSSDPVNLAAEIARDRAIVVAVGTVGMEIQRRLYYEKELDFRVSRSYGPGRYDSAYEQKGRDYPIGYVRWTETRNMEAFLHLLADRKLDVKPLITHRFPIAQAGSAYDLISGKTGQPSLGVLITYPDHTEENHQLALTVEPGTPVRGKSIAVGVLGAGAFATQTLLPVIQKFGRVRLVGICAANGSHARHAAGKFGFLYCATDEARIIDDTAINTVVVATRHHLHAAQVIAALRAGKHVFCEKPLCLTEAELAEIINVYGALNDNRNPRLMVGFNRRFAPMAKRLKTFLQEIHEPLALHYRVNAGYLPPDHWLNDLQQGGGRIRGEVCHFVDFLSFLAGSLPVEVATRGLASQGLYSGDNIIISLQFANGSQGTISYFSNGDKSFSKERVEVFGGSSVAVLEDFRRLELVRHGRRQVVRSRLRQDKGHAAEWGAFVSAVRGGGEPPIALSEIVACTLATLRAADSLSAGQPLPVDTAGFLRSHSGNDSDS